MSESPLYPDKYKIDNSLTLKSRHENNTTAAYYRHSANMMVNEINFNKKYFKNFEERGKLFKELVRKD